MKTIGYLGQIDGLFGAQATTRNWNTILTIVRILKGRSKTSKEIEYSNSSGSALPGKPLRR
jgi:hypothetical protein